MQTSYSNNPSVAFAGMKADMGISDIITRIANTRQLLSVEADTAENAADFVVTINGTAYTYTSDGSATVAEIAAGLKALIDAGDEDVTTTLFTTDASNDSFYIQVNGYTADDELTVSITNPSSGILILTELVPHGQAIPFGVVVVEDEVDSADANTGKRIGCRLPRLATDFSGRKVLGVSVADTSKITRSSSPYAGYSAGEAMPILRKGRIWMTVEDPALVSMGGLVYVRHIAGATEQLGAIRAVDDGADTEVLDAQQAQFTGQYNTALGIAVVEWNLP